VSFTQPPPGLTDSAVSPPGPDPARAPPGILSAVCQDDGAAHNPERRQAGLRHRTTP